MNRIIGLAAGVMAAIWLTLSALMSTALNEELYYAFQRAAGVDEASSLLAEDERMSLNREITMYLAGEGELSEALNSTETAHMADVKKLFDIARVIMYISFALAALGAVYSFLRARDKLIKWYLISAGAVIALLMALAALCAFDFSGAFTVFHKILFTNELWSLNYATDALVRIMPEKWFAYMGLTVLARALIRVMALYVFLKITLYLTGRSEA